MTDAMSKPIPNKKQRQVEAFPKATIPLWPSSAWAERRQGALSQSSQRSRQLKWQKLQDLRIRQSSRRMDALVTRLQQSLLGLDIKTGVSCNGTMVRQLLSEEPLKEFERILATSPLETQANCNLALDAVAVLIFPNKQKKICDKRDCGSQRSSSQLWKPKVLTIRNVCTRLHELNAQLANFRNQTVCSPKTK